MPCYARTRRNGKGYMDYKILREEPLKSAVREDYFSKYINSTRYGNAFQFKEDLNKFIEEKKLNFLQLNDEEKKLLTEIRDLLKKN